MAKHNKWSKVKHRKAVVDKRRGRVWTKVSKAIIVAARHGGPDPDTNLSLRYAIDEGRYANMPRDTIERAIRKGAGGEDTSQYESIRYEGYAPGGVAVIVEALTDNRTRTVGDVRLAFSDHGGNMGSSGCVSYMFQSKGQIVVSGAGMTEEKVFEAAIEAGATDVESIGDEETPAWMISTDPTAFLSVKAALEKAKFPITDSEIAMVPETLAAVTPEQAKAVEELVEQLEDLDDVQKVYTNVDA
ncbi:MAG: YebC/PmpR family DNA-binding transcriptional regulator [Planctomycetes bacterium]|nr:YebC/PmpR family DNA-binding transcriptional regulator [Planctomycetota bacterium]